MSIKERVQARKTLPVPKPVAAPEPKLPIEYRKVEVAAKCGHTVIVKLKPTSGPERVRNAKAKDCGPCRVLANNVAQDARRKARIESDKEPLRLTEGAVITLRLLGRRQWSGRIEADGTVVEMEGTYARKMIIRLVEAWSKQRKDQKQASSADCPEVQPPETLG